MRVIKKLSIGQRVAGAASLLLLVSMFLPWFGTKDVKTPNGIVLPARHVTIDAWRPFEFSLFHPLRSEWFVDIVLVLAIAVVLFSIFRVAGRRVSPQLRATASVAAAAAGTAATLVLLLRVLVPIHLVVRWYGLFLALLAAIVMLYGGLRWMDEEDAEVAGFTVAGAKRRVKQATRRIQQARQR